MAKHSELPTKARLAKGVRLLHPVTGIYYKHGGKWVFPMEWTGDGHIIIRMAGYHYLVTPAQIGIVVPKPTGKEIIRRGKDFDDWFAERVTSYGPGCGRD